MSHHRHTVNHEHYHSLPFGERVLSAIRSAALRVVALIEARSK